MKAPSGIEKTVDTLVGPALVIAAIIIILELTTDIEQWIWMFIEIADFSLITIFVTDLGFKYRRLHNPRMFVRKYWLDILAVMPFMLVLRVMEFLRVTEIIDFIDILIRGEQDVSLARDIQANRGSLRAHRFARYFRVLARSPRLLKAVRYFEHPHVRNVK